LGELGAEKGQH